MGAPLRESYESSSSSSGRIKIGGVGRREVDKEGGCEPRWFVCREEDEDDDDEGRKKEEGEEWGEKVLSKRAV